MSALISGLKLLDDQDIQRFIMDGMLSFHPDISSETHEEIHSLLSNCYENESPLGNNVLSRIPQMHKVLRSREVDGAITSILGKNYLLHPHRAVHRSTPVASDPSSFDIATDKYLVGENSTTTSLWHQDAQSPTARARHHLPKFIIGFYFPHDVTSEMGPTRFKLGSYMQHDESAEDNLFQPNYIKAGTFMICHFDTVHAGFPNFSVQDRYLVKFVFTRTEYPVKPRWNLINDTWMEPSTAMTQNNYSNGWQYIWKWLLGISNTGESIDNKMTQTSQSCNIEENRLDKIYKNDSNQVADLITNLMSYAGKNKHERKLVKTEHKGQTFEYDKKTTERRWNEMAVVMEDESYALAAKGKPAIAKVLPLLESEDPWIQINAMFILGEIGYESEEIVEAISKLLDSSHQQVVRQALDTLACMPNQINKKCLSSISNLLEKKPDGWSEVLVNRGWTGLDQINFNASMLLLNCTFSSKYKKELEKILTKLLNFSTGYSAKVASKGLINLQTPTALNSAITYLSDRAWDETLIPATKRY
jgi:hypothetical protein